MVKLELHARHGDVSALPACIASSLCGTTLELKYLEKGCTGPCMLKTSAGFQAFYSNPTARYVCLSSKGGDKLLPKDGMDKFKVEEWMELAESTLVSGVQKSLAHSAHHEEIDSVLAKLAAASFPLVGKSVTLADLCVWSALYPLLGAGAASDISVPAAVQAWFSAGNKLPEFAEGVKLALGGENPETFVKLAAADAALKIGPPPKLPITGARNIMITSALPYVNNVPHLGNIIGCVLSADVYARYCRARGYNVIYMCGTDEYGTATETKALEEGLAPRQICDKYNKIHADIYEWFGIQFDQFGRTSTPKQTRIAQSIFTSILDNKLLYEDGMEQLYDEVAKKFLADRFVEGTCPKCRYEDARGDQCDACGTLLNPTDLINPRSKLTGGTPRTRMTQHMFLNLPEISPRLVEYINKGQVTGGWSANTMAITNTWIRDGLKARCITRDLQWGVPVPLEHLKDKVLYVWFDAPIGYISITAAYTEDWEQWWKSKDVELVQFMGKDNVPFHTVIFPSCLIATGEDWTLMQKISTTEYLNYEDKQFSKSRGVGVFGNHCKETAVLPEVWRYYLLTNRPESADTKFLWSDLGAKNNNELLANLGNFCHRTLSFAASRFAGVMAELLPEHDAIGVEFGLKIEPLVREYVDYLERLKLKDGLRIAMKVSSAGNLFFQEQQPWVVLKTDKDKCATILACCVGLVRLLAVLVQPYMPTVTDKLMAQLGLPASAGMDLSDATLAATAAPHRLLPSGHAIGTPQPIFRNIPEEEIEEYRGRYAGSQKDDAAASAGASKGADKGRDKAKDGKPALSKDGKPIKVEKVKDAKSAEGKAEGKPVGKKAVACERAVDVSRLDIRVGKIVECKKHPDAESLYVEQIDIGEGKTRTVVSGLVKFIAMDKMVGADVLVVANMKPSAMRGVTSEGMVLCASNQDKTQTELVTPPPASKLGERVTVEGFTDQPDEVLNPKKKVFEGVQSELKTSVECIAMYKGVPFKTSAGVCTVTSIAGGSIK